VGGEGGKKKAGKQPFPRFSNKKRGKSTRMPYFFFFFAGAFFATLTFFFEAVFFTAMSAPPFMIE
jgi:hypothetical protein